MENDWLNLMNLSEEIILIQTEITYHLKNKKKQDRASEFNNLDNKVDSYDLIYEIKTE